MASVLFVGNATQALARCVPGDFILVLDVGHSPQASGARSARGVTEYEFNLRLARRLSQTLIESGFSKTVLMTTPGSGNASLVKRTAEAKRLGADLYLSVHHDAVQGRYLEKWTVGERQEDFSDRFAGYSLFVSSENADYGRSLQFAQALGTELKGRGLQYSPHHAEKIPGEGRELVDANRGIYRFDHLAVLRSAAMPAVLLESGVIVNRDEELELAKPERQKLIGDAVASAVKSYCDMNK